MAAKKKRPTVTKPKPITVGMVLTMAMFDQPFYRKLISDPRKAVERFQMKKEDVDALVEVITKPVAATGKDILDSIVKKRKSGAAGSAKALRAVAAGPAPYWPSPQWNVIPNIIADINAGDIKALSEKVEMVKKLKARIKDPTTPI